MGKPMQYGQAVPPAAQTGGNALGSTMIRPGSGVPYAPPMARTPGPQLAPGQAMNQGLPVNQNALNYLNNWYDGTPAPWGAPAQPAQPSANPYQNNVVPGPARPSRWNALNAGTPAPTTASLTQPQAVAPAPSQQQQNPNWGQLYGNGPNQFAQGFNPIAANSMIDSNAYGPPGLSGAMHAPAANSY